MNYSIIIVDQHTIEREGLVSLFKNDNDTISISDVSSGKECIEYIRNNNIDIVISDTTLSDYKGIDLILEIKSISPKVKVIFLTEDESTLNLINAYDSKIDGYLRKSVSFMELKKCIISVMNNTQYIEPNIIPILNKKLLERDTHLELLDRLTKRERQMLICVANGLSNKEIASECNISERTVKNHLSSVFQKIEVADRTQAAVFAIRTNLVQI